MKEVFLGEVIRQRRLELGLTQEYIQVNDKRQIIFHPHINCISQCDNLQI